MQSLIRIRPIARSSICIFCRIEQRNQSWLLKKSPALTFSTTSKLSRVISKSSRKSHKPYEPPREYKPPSIPNVNTTPPKDLEPFSRTIFKKCADKIGSTSQFSSLKKKDVALVWTPEARGHWAADRQKFRQLWREYVEETTAAFDYLEDESLNLNDADSKIQDAFGRLETFQKTYDRAGLKGLEVDLLDNFLMLKYSGTVGIQRDLTDLSHPEEWFPRTRTMKRVWHLHLGPTNSGKTYNALKRLEETRNGIYCGPLRLLAHEVYARFNAKGVPCNLITGEERKLDGGLDCKLVSSTVEMAAVERQFEVAVIDEIQMLSDPDRGWAWTHAVLGVMAKELHLCGEERALDILKKLAELCGEEVIVHKYQRLGKLEVAPESLKSDFSNIQKGDCIVGFSRKNIHSLKTMIESKTGLKAAIVYGGLPAETRVLQAQYFNTPDNDYDILVASDAIGLGLNLRIKRIVFSTLHKYNGVEMIKLPDPLIRQISGRAGRYRSSADDGKRPTFPTSGSPENITTIGPPADSKIGYVTTLSAKDHKILKERMQVDIPQIKKARLLPTNNIVESYASLFPADTPFHSILGRIDSQAQVSDLFELANMSNVRLVASLLNGIENLSDSEKINLSLAPVKHNREEDVKAFQEFAKAIAKGKQVTMVDFDNLNWRVLDIGQAKHSDHLRQLEELHNIAMLYQWLTQRFQYNLTGDEITNKIKAKCEEIIDKGFKRMDSRDPKSIFPRIQSGHKKPSRDGGGYRFTKEFSRSRGSDPDMKLVEDFEKQIRNMSI